MALEMPVEDKPESSTGECAFYYSHYFNLQYLTNFLGMDACVYNSSCLLCHAHLCELNRTLCTCTFEKVWPLIRGGEQYLKWGGKSCGLAVVF